MIETLSTLCRQHGHDLLSVERRSTPLAGIVPGNEVYDAVTPGGSGATYTGKPVNPNTALAYSAVWCCVNGISKALSSCNLNTHRNLSADGSQRELATTDYRFAMLRDQPNPEMSSMQWRLNGIASLLLWGNWYNLIDLDGRGRIKGIWFLRPDWVIPVRNPRTLEIEYIYQPATPWANPIKAGVYHADQILHIAGLGYDGIVGYSPISMFSNAVAIGQAQEEMHGRFLAGGGVQRVALVSPSGSALKDPDVIRAEWKKRNSGLANTGEVAILHGGLDVKTFGIPPKDAQFLEGRSWQLSEFSRIYDYPLGKLYDALAKTDSYASSEQDDITFVKHTIRPWAVLSESKINITVLGSDSSLVCEHDLYELQRGDLQSQMNAYKAGVTGMIVHPNEARGKMRLPPDSDPGADQLWGQGQMMPISNLRQQKQPKKSHPDAAIAQ